MFGRTGNFLGGTGKTSSWNREDQSSTASSAYRPMRRLRRLENVRGEFSLTTLAYNIRRATTLVGIPELIAAWAFKPAGIAPPKGLLQRIRAHGISESTTTPHGPNPQASHTARFDSVLLFTQSRTVVQPGALGGVGVISVLRHKLNLHPAGRGDFGHRTEPRISVSRQAAGEGTVKLTDSRTYPAAWTLHKLLIIRSRSDRFRF